MNSNTDRLLTSDEIKSHLHRISTAAEGYEFTPDDGTILGGNRIEFVTIKSLLQAQHDLTKKQYEGWKSPDDVVRLLNQMANECKTLREKQIAEAVMGEQELKK